MSDVYIFVTVPDRCRDRCCHILQRTPLNLRFHPPYSWKRHDRHGSYCENRHLHRASRSVTQSHSPASSSAVVVRYDDDISSSQLISHRSTCGTRHDQRTALNASNANDQIEQRVWQRGSRTRLHGSPASDEGILTHKQVILRRQTDGLHVVVELSGRRQDHDGDIVLQCEATVIFMLNDCLPDEGKKCLRVRNADKHYT